MSEKGKGQEVVGWVKNAHLVTDHFGCWPTFHDAEILRVELSRPVELSPAAAPTRVVLDLYDYAVSREVDEKGHGRLTRRCVVTFALEDIVELEMEGFSCQNVIFGMAVSRKGDGFEVTLEPCFGLTGSITCRSIEVLRLEPLPDLDG